MDTPFVSLTYHPPNSDPPDRPIKFEQYDKKDFGNNAGILFFRP